MHYKENKQVGICQSFICQKFLIENSPKFFSRLNIRVIRYMALINPDRVYIWLFGNLQHRRSNKLNVGGLKQCSRFLKQEIWGHIGLCRQKL